MARDFDPYKLSSPRVFLVRMAIFLIITAFVPLVLYRQVSAAFLGNPWLNGIILIALFIGILLAAINVIRLIPEVRWVNSFRQGGGIDEATPSLLAPMATLLRDQGSTMALSTSTWRSLLESIATRLDENREILRYLTGLLVFLGLLGTFWGLLDTVGSVGRTISALDVSSTDAAVIFEDLKAGLEAPLSGMAIAFSSSLFGLAGSLVLGFLDLQAGQAQNRFYTELEDWLSSLTGLEDFIVEDEMATDAVTEIRQAVDRLSRTVQDGGANRGTAAAMANLAEGIQGLVQHMRAEQQMVRDWVEGQAEQAQSLEQTLARLADAQEARGSTTTRRRSAARTDPSGD